MDFYIVLIVVLVFSTVLFGSIFTVLALFNVFEPMITRDELVREFKDVISYLKNYYGK